MHDSGDACTSGRPPLMQLFIICSQSPITSPDIQPEPEVDSRSIKGALFLRALTFGFSFVRRHSHLFFTAENTEVMISSRKRLMDSHGRLSCCVFWGGISFYAWDMSNNKQPLPMQARRVRNLMSWEYSMAAWQTRVNKTRRGSVYQILILE